MTHPRMHRHTRHTQTPTHPPRGAHTVCAHAPRTRSVKSLTKARADLKPGDRGRAEDKARRKFEKQQSRVSQPIEHKERLSVTRGQMPVTHDDECPTTRALSAAGSSLLCRVSGWSTGRRMRPQLRTSPLTFQSAFFPTTLISDMNEKCKLWLREVSRRAVCILAICSLPALSAGDP